MKVQGNYTDNLGLTNVLQRCINGAAYRSSALPKDTFQNAPANTAVNSNTYANATVPFTKFYSPKQLLNAYINPEFVKKQLDSNPELKNLLSASGLEGKIYPENISKISNSHLTTTTAYALQTANKMNLSASDKQLLEQACVFHDFGKILIPHEIIDKPGELTPQEKQIMDLHAEFGYQLLSKTGINQRVLNMVRNHHMPQTVNNDILGQILSVADIYSALREERSYKSSLSEQDAIKILDQKAQNGEVSTEVVNTLKSVIANSTAA